MFLPIPNTLPSFVVFFYDTFMLPIIRLCQQTEILGYSFFEWLLGLTVVSISIHFLIDLFNSDNRGS